MTQILKDMDGNAFTVGDLLTPRIGDTVIRCTAIEGSVGTFERTDEETPKPFKMDGSYNIQHWRRYADWDDVIRFKATIAIGIFHAIGGLQDCAVVSINEEAKEPISEELTEWREEVGIWSWLDDICKGDAPKEQGLYIIKGERHGDRYENVTIRPKEAI